MKQKYLISAIVLVIGFVAFAGLFSGRVGSVASTETYYATTTTSADASATLSYVACKGSCVLGSVIVTQPGTAGYVKFWDATTTATSTFVEPSPFSSTTYAVAVGRAIGSVAGASDVGGTYTFDVRNTYGLVIETSSAFDGEYVVTYKR